ncbi:MAG: hypothetical protein EHM75_07485, partial [Desulfobacteraceae bacterium]
MYGEEKDLFVVNDFWVPGVCRELAAGSGREVDALHLINLLKQKGVLTQEEADSLMKEVRKTAKEEKTALKEEIKEDAKKGDY